MAASMAGLPGRLPLLPLLLLLLPTQALDSGPWRFPAFSLSPGPPEVVAPPARPLALPCRAATDPGAAPPAVRWRREGLLLELPGHGRRLLSNGSLLLEAGAERAGSYQCQASLPGVGTILSTPTVVTAPGNTRFLLQPVDLTVFLTQTAVFQCRAEPAGSQTRWLKNDSPLQLDRRMLVLPSGALEITDVNIGDRASYRCQVAGALSVPAGLKLMALPVSAGPAPPAFLVTPRSRAVLLGGEVTLECAANGVPQPRVSWLKDGRELELEAPGSRFLRTGQGSLTIRPVELADEGGFQCRAENSEDSIDSGVELAVLEAPRLARAPVSHTAYEKDDVLFQCSVAGRPEPAVQWYKNGDLIIQSEYFQMVHGTSLRILGLVSSDSGVYQCIGRNAAGSVQAAAQLRVHSKDGTSSGSTTRPLALPGGGVAPGPGQALLQSAPAAPANLEAVITSTRFLTLAWAPPASAGGPVTGYSVFYRQHGSERERVVNSTRGTLEEVSLQGLLPGTLYTVRVVAHNEHGPGASSHPLEITTQSEVAVPGSPRGVAARATSSFSILVSWTPPAEEVQRYKLYYRRGEYAADQEAEVGAALQFHLTELREYTEYTFWVSAFNENGEGGHSEEVPCRTYSDTPADPPQNVTIESASSSSIIVRWQPPPKESQNGVLTGYKLRWRKSGKSGGSKTVSTDSSRRLYAIAGLTKGKQYQVKVSALTVNGSGPSTGWLYASTFESDLDETIVPDPPSSLRAKAEDDSVTIVWSPPSSKTVLVRGYTIGWGKGIPDEYTKVVDNKQRYFVIEDLKPNSEYVISLRAYNSIGDGRPIYETTRTSLDAPQEQATPLVPPVGLHAIVLSSTTVVLTWMDSTLPRNQLITDNRYYIVRYTSTLSMKADRPKHNYRNATDLNSMLDDLRPNTEYEFTVKVVRGRRQSPWSLVVFNSTQEAAPASPPRDLAVLGSSQQPAAITLTWLPPRRPNGRINGYVIFYTVDRRRDDREWVVEGVIGDKTDTVIEQLEPSTKYFFKIQARNSKGYGPLSPVVAYRTKSGAVQVSGRQAGQGGIPPNVQYAIFATGGVVVLVAVMFGLVMCRRGARAAEREPEGPKAYHKGEPGSLREKLNPPPPDLWINHDQLELKSVDSGQEDPGGRVSSLRGMTPVDLHGSSSTLDRSRYIAPYSGTESELSFGGRQSQRRLLRQARPGQPLKIAAINGKHKGHRYLSKESVASSLPGGPGSCSSSTYIRSQYNLNPPPTLSPHSPEALPGYCPAPHAPSSVLSEGPPSTVGDFQWANTTTSSIDEGSSSLQGCGGCHPPHPGGATYLSSAMSTSSADSGSATGSGNSRTCSGSSGSAGGRRPTHLKSFNQPSSLHGLSQPKAVFVRPGPPSSPFKRGLATSSPCSSAGQDACSPATVNPRGLQFTPLPAMAEVRSPDMLHPQDGPCDCLQPSYSTEELTNEMINLETVMKDLNAISGPGQHLPQQC